MTDQESIFSNTRIGIKKSCFYPHCPEIAQTKRSKSLRTDQDQWLMTNWGAYLKGSASWSASLVSKGSLYELYTSPSPPFTSSPSHSHLVGAAGLLLSRTTGDELRPADAEAA
ncbi:hypothetical protein GUJ93_ZPchr0001g31998 [Zizania palustris]|uniref:Uncharacterized protein n=1 Tax=Zizania palustris TaxID=103762 RepID=A0A8J5RMC1_ZIZPA|nr:hypothetical protein GUJ93_ZPchr0001g31998 [Zizania palustris]